LSISGKLRQSAPFLPLTPLFAIDCLRMTEFVGCEACFTQSAVKESGLGRMPDFVPQSCLHRKARFSVRPGKPFLRPRLLPISHRESGGQGWPPGHRASGAERGLEGREPDGLLKSKGLPPKNRRETATLASLAPLSGSKSHQNKGLSQHLSGTAGSRQRPCDRDARQTAGTPEPLRDAIFFVSAPE
jgi:hypothetical protein